MRPRELFPRSASLRNMKRKEDGKIPQTISSIPHSVDDNQSYDKEKRSVNESLDNLLVQLEKMKNEKPLENNDNIRFDDNSITEGNRSMNDDVNLSQSDMSFKRIEKQKLIISNLEKKAPEPVWGGRTNERGNNKITIEKNVIDTKSIHIETEDATLTEYTESRYTDSKYTSEPEPIPRKESPIRDITPKSSIERMMKRNDSAEVKSFKSSISNGLQRSSSGNSTPPSKPVSIIHEREKKNSKGSLSPSLLSSSAWQYFNSNKEEHRVIHPSQTPTSLGNNSTIYKSPKVLQRNRSFNNSRIAPPMMSSIDGSKTPSINNDRSSLRKVDSIDNDTNDVIKPPSIITSRSNSIDSNSVKESKIKKFGKLVRNASLSGNSKSNNASKPLYVISPALPAAKPESSPLVKEEMIPSPTTGRLRRRVPPEKEKEERSKVIHIDTDLKNVSDKISVGETEVSSHSLLPSFSFNETPLSIEICNALVQDTINKKNEDESTLDLYNALNDKNSQVVNPSNRKYRSHRRSMPHPRSVISTTPKKSREENIDEEESNIESNATEKQSIVLVSPHGLQKFNMVKRSRSTNNHSNRQMNENISYKEKASENNIGMESSLRLENGRLEVTVGGKDRELNELAEKLLMEGNDSKSLITLIKVHTLLPLIKERRRVVNSSRIPLRFSSVRVLLILLSFHHQN